MEYQNILNLLNNTNNQSTKFRKINLVEVNHESSGTCNSVIEFNFNNRMLRSSLFDYSDTDILMKETRAFAGAGVDTAIGNVDKKQIINIQQFFMIRKMYL